MTFLTARQAKDDSFDYKNVLPSFLFSVASANEREDLRLEKIMKFGIYIGENFSIMQCATFVCYNVKFAEVINKINPRQ